MNAPFTIRVCEDPDEWDAAVWARPLGNVFCSWPWGEYKSRTGWSVTRLMILDGNNDLLCLVQMQTRTIGVARLIYLQGGPLLTPKGQSRAESVLRRIQDHLALRAIDVVVINFEHFSCAFATAALLGLRFVPVHSSRYYTLELDVTRDLGNHLASVTQDWRRNVRRLERNPEITAKFVDDPEERLASFDRFWAMFQDLRRRKGFDSNLQGEHARDIFANDPHFRFLEIWNGAECIIVRIAHVSAQRFTDLFVGSTESAKAVGAAAFSIWRFAERAAAEKCEVFDLGGVDPGRNRAVFNFKRGLSTDIVESGPRWVWGRSAILRNAVATYFALS